MGPRLRVGLLASGSSLTLRVTSWLQDGLDRLDQSSHDLVRIGLRVWSTIFHVALVPVVDEAMWNPDGGTSVGNAIAKLVDRLGLVKTG